MKKYVVVGIALLFIVTSVTPLVIGYNAEIKDIDSELETKLANLQYLCTIPDGFNEVEYEYYKEELLIYHSNDKVVIEEGKDKTIVQDDLPSTVSFSPMGSSWSMMCHDTHHTSQSPYSTAGNPYDEVWKFRSDKIEGGPVIGEDETLYFGDFDYHIYAVNPNGTLKWIYKTNGWIWSTPAIAEDGAIFVSGFDDFLYAVNPDGTLKWRFHSPGSIVSSPAIADDGTIYFGTMWGLGDGGQIFALNPNGTEKWQYQTGYHITSDPAIADDGTVYIGSGDDYLYAMNPNGTLKWRFKTGGVIKGPASIADDGTVYVGSADDYLYALYPDNGSMKWSYNIDYGTESNPSIDSDGTIYCGGKYLYAVNPDGTEKWTFDYGPGNSHMSCPTISADGTIYIGTVIDSENGGDIIAVNPDGTERWRKRIATDSVQSSPCIGEDGTVYIGSCSRINGYTYGYLHAFSDINPDAPYTPTITGETNGGAGKEYEYTFSATDPNGDDVSYYIEWGYTEDHVTVGPYSSGEEITLSYSWPEDRERGYIIIARAGDTDGNWGPVGELRVTMPISQQDYSFPLLQRLLERFPNAFPILRHLLGLYS